MEDRKGAASICNRRAQPGHPRQSMVRRRFPEVPSFLKVIMRSRLTNGSAHFRNCRIETKLAVEYRSCQFNRSLDEEAQ